MIMPRFTIRTAFIGVTCCALLFIVVGMAVRGETWAWGISIGVISLLVTMLVHAGWFGLVWMFARLPEAQTAVPVCAAATANTRPSQTVDDRSENRVEAQR